MRTRRDVLRARVLGLVALGAVAACFFVAAAFWTRILRLAVAEEIRGRGEYFARVWLVAFAFCAAAWIWLLIKTIRGDVDDDVQP